VTNFGAFVDIGVHQDGLVHISQLADKFVKDPREVVSAGDRVQVRVMEVKLEKQQIALSMKSGAGAGSTAGASGNAGPRPAPSQGGNRDNARPAPHRGGPPPRPSAGGGSGWGAATGGQFSNNPFASLGKPRAK
jgi:uncharacterized protein